MHSASASSYRERQRDGGAVGEGEMGVWEEVEKQVMETVSVAAFSSYQPHGAAMSPPPGSRPDLQGGDPTHSYFSLAPLKMPNTPQPLGYMKL